MGVCVLCVWSMKNACVVSRLAVTGKQMPLPSVTYTLPTGRSSRSTTPTAGPPPHQPPHLLDLHDQEEIIEQNGDVEEILAIDNISLAGGRFVAVLDLSN